MTTNTDQLRELYDTYERGLVPSVGGEPGRIEARDLLIKAVPALLDELDQAMAEVKRLAGDLDTKSGELDRMEMERDDARGALGDAIDAIEDGMDAHAKGLIAKDLDTWHAICDGTSGGLRRRLEELRTAVRPVLSPPFSAYVPYMRGTATRTMVLAFERWQDQAARVRDMVYDDAGGPSVTEPEPAPIDMAVLAELNTLGYVHGGTDRILAGDVVEVLGDIALADAYLSGFDVLGGDR